MQDIYSGASLENSKKQARMDFLNTIYKNAETGISSIESLNKHVEDEKLKSVILAQYEDYMKFCAKLSSHITKDGETPKKNNVFTKANMWSSINMSAFMDDSSSHIADMMIKGSNMGITNLNKELNQHSAELDDEPRALAHELLSIEEKNIEQLKPFL